MYGESAMHHSACLSSNKSIKLKKLSRYRQKVLQAVISSGLSISAEINSYSHEAQTLSGPTISYSLCFNLYIGRFDIYKYIPFIMYIYIYIHIISLYWKIIDLQYRLKKPFSLGFQTRTADLKLIKAFSPKSDNRN